MNTNKNSNFDIPTRTFDFKKDLTYGHEGEMLVDGFLEALSSGSFEVKSDRYRNGRMVIETDQNPRGMLDENGNKVWVKSGLNVTTAKWWVYIFSPEGGFVVISVARLKAFLRANQVKYNQSTKRDFGGSDNPAKGYLIMPDDVMDLLRNNKYDLGEHNDK